MTYALHVHKIYARIWISLHFSAHATRYCVYVIPYSVETNPEICLSHRIISGCNGPSIYLEAYKKATLLCNNGVKMVEVAVVIVTSVVISQLSSDYDDFQVFPLFMRVCVRVCVLVSNVPRI